MAKAGHPKILLIGAGYTLRRVALHFGPENCMCLVSSRESVQSLGMQNFPHVSDVDVSNSERIVEFFDQNQNFNLVIDSVPPLAGLGPADWSRGVRNIIDQLKKRPPEKIIYLSTTGVFGVNDGSWVNEDSVPSPTAQKARARLACEEAYRDSGIPCIALRISGIYGPGRGLGLLLKENRFRGWDDLERWSNRIHVEDLVSAIVAVANLPIAELPPVLSVSDDSPAQMREVVSYYQTLLGLTGRPSSSPLNSEAVREVTNQRVSNCLLKKVLGTNLKYPTYKEGVGTEFVTK